MRRILFLFFTLFLWHYSFAQRSAEKRILENMLAGCNAVNTAKFTLRSVERSEKGSMNESEMIVKLQTRPKEIYIYCTHPNSGTEALWSEVWSDKKLLINPSGFPYINIRLDPYSSLLRKDSHHTIHEIGFEYVTSMVNYYSHFYGENFYNYLFIEDTVLWDNHSCIILSFDFKDFDTRLYLVQAGETITSIAGKLHVNDYSILRKNPTLRNYNDVHAGQIIKVPNFYNRRIEFYIDRHSWLPLKQLIYDESGLFEQYEMKSFFLNPQFDSEEFTPAFKEYKF